MQHPRGISPQLIALETPLPPPPPLDPVTTTAAPQPAVNPSPFLATCRGEVCPRRPIWLMRQAGRILEPYRRLKEEMGALEQMFRNPEIAARVTLMPVEMLGVDAAILFADIFTPVDAMGCEVTFAPGPIPAFAVREPDDVARLHDIDAEANLGYVGEILEAVRAQLPATVALIGFAGAPVTLATYLAEGPSGGREFTIFRRMLRRDPETTHRLLDQLTSVCIDYLTLQTAHGAQALQLFDTWIGSLSAADFAEFSLPRLQRIFAVVRELDVPSIYYANNAAHLMPMLDQVGADVLSLDWRIDLSKAFTRFDGKPLQGNLDPCALFGSPKQVTAETRNLLDGTQSRPHIVNLGHGVHPDTPIEAVQAMIDATHSYKSDSE
ncbi:MAG: uroporphyrinogen decarboxylase [Candidatus Latescibacterota bacterium]|nr:uroporphyrinogen decarboxylase [Candidatus Latescibacterota bacterium]